MLLVPRSRCRGPQLLVSLVPRSRRATICFVTNLGEEKPHEEKRIRVTQQFIRNGEPLSNQVTDDMFQAVRDETISQEDMDYWFTENQDDIIEERFLKPLEEIPNTDFTVRNEDWDSEKIDTLRVGDVRTAEIIGIHLYHGAVIDLGTQYHGIIPVNESQWPDLNDTLTLEKTPPNEYEPPMIISPDMDPLEVVKASGRDYEPSTYVQDDPEDAPNRMLEKIDFKDKFGPAAEYPLEIRYALGELEGEELEEYEDWLESDEAKIMDVDALFSEEALSSHLLRAECLAGQLEQDTSLDKFY